MNAIFIAHSIPWSNLSDDEFFDLAVCRPPKTNNVDQMKS